MAQTNEDSLGVLYHPLHGEQLENPYPFYSRARREEPIFFSSELATWVITKYDDVMSILTQPGIFSSKDALRPVVEFSPAVFAELSKGYPIVPNMIDSDGKEHVRFRSAVGKAFVPKRIRQLEPFIKEVTLSLVEVFINNHQAEVISQLAYPLPLEVVLFLIGVPKEDMALAKKMSDSLSMLVNSPLPEEQQVECARGFVSFQHYIIQLVNERRSVPKEDLISDLLETPPGEKPFDDAQFANLLTSMVVAGHETVTQLIGNGLAVLLEQPERWQALCAHPERIPQAIEEILRYDSPVHAFFRTTTREVTVGGITFPPETSLLVVFGSANQDETHFPQVDQFDMQRSPNHHLAFGHGVHFCIGAFLARKEAQIVFEMLCQRLPNLRLAPQQTLSHIPILRQRGFVRLDVVW
ncbi:MAG TPA: cytochrome P450 [Ktedonobacteraceae bacterium]|jgi:cytochrome P450